MHSTRLVGLYSTLLLGGCGLTGSEAAPITVRVQGRVVEVGSNISFTVTGAYDEPTQP
jgi:hypothetical protein